MEFLCGLSVDYHVDYENNNSSYTTVHAEKFSPSSDYPVYDNFTEVSDDNVARSVSHYEVAINSFIIPGVCIFGLLGNLLAFIVLGCRVHEGVDSLEKGSLLSMIGKYRVLESTVAYNCHSEKKIFLNQFSYAVQTG